MTTAVEEHIEYDREKICNSVRLQLPIEITTYTLSHNMEIYVNDILKVFLEECYQEHLLESLKFCMGELLTNAKKANTKRVYFREQGLDINDPEEYRRGMETCKVETLAKIDHYLEMQKKLGLYIKVLFQFCGKQIKIQIKNNSVLTFDEEIRINSKINNAKKFNNLEEVYAKALDQSEGAGLGIIIIILMLKKFGIGRDNFRIFSTDKETITEIILPCNLEVYSAIQMISYEYVNFQDKIPIREETYNTAQKLFSAKEIDRNKLFYLCMQDDTMALLLMKNTAAKGKLELDLVKTVSAFTDEELKGIVNLNNPDIEVMEFKNLEEGKLHSQKVAFFIYNLCKNNPELQSLFTPEEFYGVGLINNIGMEILKNPTVMQNQYIEGLSNEYCYTERIKKVFYSGNAAPYLEMLYLKKLRFSEDVQNICGCWTNPEFAPERYKNFLSAIYIAEALVYYSEKKIEYYQIDIKQLAKFGIYTETQFKYILNKLDDAVIPEL